MKFLVNGGKVTIVDENIMNEKLSNKRIVFVINTLREGGAAKILTFVANLCIESFKDVYVITTFSGESAIPLDDRINLIDLKINIIKSIITKATWRLNLARKLRNKIKQLDPDVVCAFISDVVVNTKLALIGTKIPLIAAERGDPYTLPKVWQSLTKWAYNTCDFLVFQTEMARDFFGEEVKNKSVVIPNPYISESNEDVFQGVRKKTVVSAGRFTEQKGYDVLIKAFKNVHNKFQDYKLIIYGEGKLRGEYERLIAELNLQDSVSLPGYMTHMQSVIREDSVFVLSSRFEGIPNSLLEAMTAGVPTVSTNCTPGGPAFLTENGRRGVLVPIDDVDAIADGIIKILSNEQYAKQLSLVGIELKKELEPSNISARWMNFFMNSIN